jgi:enoyl-CoA hydratase
MKYENILVDVKGAVGLVTLNRPKALNALSSALIDELNAAMLEFDRSPGIGCIVLTGSEKAFAAGADIKEMKDKNFVDAYLSGFLESWDRLAEVRTPLVAAVAGFCLGGGAELAMMCDIIIAADTAKFGQPEIGVGILPGAGGTQRLTRAIGKAKTMDLVLTGRMMDAAEAERCGLVARVVPADKLMIESLAVAERVASFSRPISMMAKESVNRSFEVPLAEGLRFERRLLLAMFATEDQKEGMSAFVEKRAPQFRNR